MRSIASFSALMITLSGWLEGATPGPRPERLDQVAILKHLKPNPIPAEVPASSREVLQRFYVTEGFRVDLVAADPDVVQPIAFTFDALGRLWVLEALSYPEKQPEGAGKDRLVILEDFDGDGVFEDRKVFVEGLNLASGFELGYGGVWIGAAPQLLFLPDRDGDDVPDGPPQVLLDGFGYQDTHETLNNFTWGPDGWLYGLQGVFNESRIGVPGASESDRRVMRAGVWRYHPVNKRFEVYAHGGSNQWGLDYDRLGRWFMTHCRSFWGGGPTTHVLQGGHYWNQAHAHYPDFIEPYPLEAFSDFRQCLPASAKYGHGEGGAGLPGSRAIYGGHSHVGTLIYQGDQWPEAFRNRLYTHNLHGRQINVQVNVEDGASVETRHAGQDFLYHDDPSYVAVDLKTGPDGSVYINDWVDLQHCHHPNVDQWQRQNGRLYRVVHEAHYKPHLVDLNRKSDRELAWLHLHQNEWYVRMARRLLTERAAANGSIASEALVVLRNLSVEHANVNRRLRALWTLHGVGGVEASHWSGYFNDSSAEVRAWAVELAQYALEPTPALAGRLVQLALSESSAMVLVRLAAISSLLPEEEQWSILKSLVQKVAHQEDGVFRSMTWFALAQAMQENPQRAFGWLADETPLIPLFEDWIPWYGARLQGQGLDLALERLVEAPPEEQSRLLQLIGMALRQEAQVPMPRAWLTGSAPWLQHGDPVARRSAENLAAIFGDRQQVRVMRLRLGEAGLSKEDKTHALAILERLGDSGSSEPYLGLLEEDAFRQQAIAILGRMKDPRIAQTLIRSLTSWPARDQRAALEALSGQPTFAATLMEAIEKEELPVSFVNAYTLRRLQALEDPRITEKASQIWGGMPPQAELSERIQFLEKRYAEAPLWAYEEKEGQKHFEALCASCHRMDEDDGGLGPRLGGSGQNGVRYFLESILDPHAVVGFPYQSVTLRLKDGRQVSGIVEAESESAWLMRQQEGTRLVDQQEVLEVQRSQQSLMPDGLLEGLQEREVLELLKFLMTL
ncbi:MAG: PVC-type heme-binding CxxCH protein [Verrucomicrobiales bacterium]